MTQGNGNLVQYDSATESIKITDYWTSYAASGQAVTLRIKGWRMPNSRGEYSFYVKTADQNGIDEYDIDQGQMTIQINPQFYALDISSDKTKVEDTDATITIKFILEEPFVIATDVFKVLAPPVNKDFEIFASSGITPIHKPEHDAPPGTTIASKLKFTALDGTPHENAVTNDFASFDYNSWSSREFWFYVESYTPIVTTQLEPPSDFSYWTNNQPSGGYFEIQLLKSQMPPSTRPLSYWTVTHERCDTNLVAGKCPLGSTTTTKGQHSPLNSGSTTPTQGATAVAPATLGTAKALLVQETVLAPKFELKFVVTFGSILPANSYFLISTTTSTCDAAAKTAAKAKVSPAFTFTCLPAYVCDLTSTATYVEVGGVLYFKVSNPKSTLYKPGDSLTFSVTPDDAEACTGIIPDPADTSTQTQKVITYWTDQNQVDFAIEELSVIYGNPRTLVIEDWANTQNYQVTTLTLVLDLDYDFHFAEWLEVRIPMALQDILQPTTTTLTAAENVVIAVPEIYYIPKTGGAEQQITSATDMDFIKVDPDYENKWFQRFILKLFRSSAITAEPADPNVGLIKLKFSAWRNAATKHPLDGYSAQIIQKHVFNHADVADPLFHKSVLQQFVFPVMQTSAFRKTGLTSRLLTQEDTSQGNYAEIMFDTYTPQIAMSAQTQFRLRFPAELTFADGHTAYEQFSCTCYSSLCTSQTGVSTTSTASIIFENLLSTFTTPYFTDTQTLHHSVVGSWQVPAWATTFNFQIVGYLKVTEPDNSSKYHAVFLFTYTTLSTSENLNFMNYILSSPESGAKTTLTMSYFLQRQLIEDTFIELKFPPYNYKGLSDVSINPVYTHITQSKYKVQIIDKDNPATVTDLTITSIDDNAKTRTMQVIRIWIQVGAEPSAWLGKAGDTLKIEVQDFVNPEIGNALKNLESSVKTNRYALCATNYECYTEKMKTTADSKIEASLPKVSVGSMEYVYGQYSVDMEQMMLKLTWTQGTLIPDSTKLLFRFSTQRQKDYSNAAAGYWEDLRLPSNLQSLRMTIDRSSSNVDSTIFFSSHNVDHALPGISDPTDKYVILLVENLYKTTMNYDPAANQQQTLTIQGIQNPSYMANTTVLMEFQKREDLADPTSYLTTDVVVFNTAIVEPVRVPAVSHHSETRVSDSADLLTVNGDTDMRIKYQITNEISLRSHWAVLLDLPKRNINYNYGFVGTPYTAESMIDTSQTLEIEFYSYTEEGQSEKLINQDAFGIKHSITAGSYNPDQILAVFDLTTPAAVRIPSGTTIDIVIKEGLKNPPNLKPVVGFELKIYVSSWNSSCKLNNVNTWLDMSAIADCRLIDISRQITDQREGFAASKPQATFGSLLVKQGLNIQAADPAQYEFDWTFPNRLPSGSLLEFKLDPGIGVNQDSSKPSVTFFDSSAACTAPPFCPSGRDNIKFIQAVPGTLIVDPSNDKLMPSAGVPAATHIKLDLTNWQNPVLYVVYEIKINSYFVDQDGEQWQIDEFNGFTVDLTNAEPKQTLILTVEPGDAFTLSDGVTKSPTTTINGEITTLSIEYKQERGYAKDRIFELSIPKVPIHYIKEGFIPQNGHPAYDPKNFEKAQYKAYLSTDNKATWTPICKNSCTLYNDDIAAGALVDHPQKGVERQNQDGWDPTKLLFFLDNVKLDVMPPGNFHYWKFVIYPYLLPPSTKQDSAWESIFKVHRYDPLNAALPLYETALVSKEFVKRFQAGDAGLLSTQQLVLNDDPLNPAFLAETIVLGTEDNNYSVTTNTGPQIVKAYVNAEIMFQFTVQNPIIQQGRLRIYYPQDNTDWREATISWDKTKGVFRCFEETCLPTTALEIKTDAINGKKYVEVSKLFENPSQVRKTGYLLKFSLSGWTLPAPVVASNPMQLTFDIQTKWVEDVLEYDIDEYKSFKLEMKMPNEQPTVSYDQNRAGDLAILSVKYNLVKQFLPFSWLSLSVPKQNKNYERLENDHQGGAIQPVPFFQLSPTQLSSPTDFKLKCMTVVVAPDLTTTTSEIESSIALSISWTPNLASWDEDTLFVKFGDVSYDKAKCDHILFEIPSMKTPPNTKGLFATFKLEILTNRNKDLAASDGDTTAAPTYLIEEMNPFTTADAIQIQQTLPRTIDGEYSNDQAMAIAAGQSPLDFTYTFTARLGNAVTKEHVLEIAFPPEFNINLKDGVERTNQLNCAASVCGSGSTWEIEKPVTLDSNWNNIGERKVLVIRKLFSIYKTEGEQIQFTLKGWSHKVGEQCNSFILRTSWHDTVTNLVYYSDYMTSLLLQQSSLRAVDCVVKSSTVFLDASTVEIKRLSGGTLSANYDNGVVQSYHKTLNYNTIFQAKGTACETEPQDANIYKYQFQVFAKQSDGQKLDPRYVEIQNQDRTQGTVEIHMNYGAFPGYDSVLHAVYVIAQNSVSTLSENWYCFMITNCPQEDLQCTGASNLCEKYCKVQRINPFARNEINYIQGSAGECFSPLTYTDEYGLVSNNGISCPILHQYTPDPKASSPFAVSDYLELVNYSMEDGSFSLTKVTFPTKTYRSFKVEACVAGELDTDSAFFVYIYKKDCTEAAYINYVATHNIAIYPTVKKNTVTGELEYGSLKLQTFNHEMLGFSTSDAKCPIEIAITSPKVFEAIDMKRCNHREDWELQITDPSTGNFKLQFKELPTSTSVFETADMQADADDATFLAGIKAYYDRQVGSTVTVTKQVSANVATYYATVMKRYTDASYAQITVVPAAGNTSTFAASKAPKQVQTPICTTSISSEADKDVLQCQKKVDQVECDFSLQNFNLATISPQPTLESFAAGWYDKTFTFELKVLMKSNDPTPSAQAKYKALEVTRQITFEIKTCDKSTCFECDQNKVLYATDSPSSNIEKIGKYHSDLSETQRKAILDIGTGCTYCKPGFNEQVELKRGVKLELVRNCTTQPQSAIEGSSCGYGMVFNGEGDCVPCNDVLKGCKLCTSKETCIECEDSSKNPLPIINSFGNSFLECSAGMKVFSNCDVKEEIRKVCQNCTAGTTDYDQATCQSCTQTSFTDGFQKTFDDCADCDMYSYFTGTDCSNANCIPTVKAKALGCTCTDKNCRICFAGTCYMCAEGKFLNKQGECTDLPTATKKLVYFTRPFSQFDPNTSPTASDFNFRTANAWNEYTIFPQQIQRYVENVLEKDVREYKIVNVTVYVAPGDYFFFNCFGKFVEANACELLKGAIDWCTELQLTLPGHYTKYDNIHLHFVNMCTHWDEIYDPVTYGILDQGDSIAFLANAQQGTVDQTDIRLNNLCSVLESDNSHKELITDPPVFNIMDPYFKFNITGSMTFEGISFNGKEGAAYYTKTHFPPPNRIPELKCDLTKDPLEHQQDQILESNWNLKKSNTLGSQYIETFNFKRRTDAQMAGGGTDIAGSLDALQCSPSTINSDATYSLKSDYFTWDKSAQECTSSDALGSLRSEAGMPYHSDFWEVDPNTRMFYLRHNVLFNLYNFPGGVGVDPSTNVALTIKNCTFETFFKDYEALIYVENNNMMIQNLTAHLYPSHAPNLMIFSDDRGVTIDIDQATFRSSRFTKGLLVYEGLGNVQSSVFNTVIVLAREFWSRLSSVSTLEKADAEIKVTNSHFENLAVGLSIDKLSYEDKFSAVYGLKSIEYKYFDNFGAVINSRGFPGTISFKKNTIKSNLVYIKDVKPDILDSSYTIESSLQKYEDTINGQLKTCAKSGSVKNNLFETFLNPLSEQPAEQLSYLETYSAVYIQESAGPVLFTDNLFEENMGISGAAISINNPDMRGSDPKAFIVLKRNTFKHNQAYLTGNAVHVRFTYNATALNTTEARVCGGGFQANNNTFLDNSSVIHASNGGAISLVCDFTTVLSNEASSDRVMNFPKNKYTAVADPIDFEVFVVSDFFSEITNNYFTGNEVGQKGSAIYTRQLSQVRIKENIFSENQPGYFFRKAGIVRPYDFYFLPFVFDSKETQTRKEFTTGKDFPYRTIFSSLFYCLTSSQLTPPDALALNIPGHSSNKLLCPSESEIDYINEKFSSTEKVQLPQLQGLIYMENCLTCRVTNVQPDDQTCSTCIHLTPQEAEISHNNYTNNYEGLMMYTDQTLARASHLMVFGSLNIDFLHNNIYNQQSNFKKLYPLSRIKENIINYVPRDYFLDLHNPLIRITLPKAGEDASGLHLKANFENNFFSGLWFRQPFVTSHQYKGAIIELDTQVYNATLHLEQNTFQDIRIKDLESIKAGLIYSNGATVEATKNDFKFIGQVSNAINQVLGVSGDSQITLFDPTRYKDQSLMQTRGVFWIVTGPKVTKHEFLQNTFDNIFCVSGCIYSIDGVINTQPTFIHFCNNQYSSVFGTGVGAIMNTASLIDTVILAEGEKLQHVQSGAYEFDGDETKNVNVTFSNCDFLSSFGNFRSAMITLRGVSNLTVEHINFQNKMDRDSNNLVGYEQFDLTEWSKKDSERFNISTYIRMLPQRVLFTDYLDTNATNGQLFSPQIAGNQAAIVRLNLVDYGILTNCTFENLSSNSKKASLLIVETDSWIQIENSKLINNEAQQSLASSVLLADNSQMDLFNVTFQYNVAGTAPGVYVTRKSSLNIVESYFRNNVATQQVGAILLEQNCELVISFSEFTGNAAFESISVLKSNKAAKVIIDNTLFQENFSQSILFSIAGTVPIEITNSTFISNFASSITPGISLSTSELKMHNVTILAQLPGQTRRRILQQTENLNPIFNQVQYSDLAEASQAGEQIIAGFFMASATSKLDLDEIVLDGTKGSVASAIYVQIGCSLELKNSIIKNIGSSEHSSPVIKGETPQEMRILNSNFDSNKNTYIRSESGGLIIEGSSFKNGSGKSFVSVTNAELTSSKSTYSGNYGEGGAGMGIDCSSCKKVAVTQSTFTDMTTDGYGGAVSLDKACNTNLSTNTFVDVGAELGGAIALRDSQVSVDNSDFQRVRQNFTYTTEDFYPNLLNEFKGVGISEESYAAIFVECTDPSKMGNKQCGMVSQDSCNSGDACCFEVERSVFTDPTGSSIPQIPPPPFVPAHPKKLAFDFTPEEGFTKILNFADIHDDQELNEQVSQQLQDNPYLQRTWRQYVKQAIQVTSGREFQFTISLLDKKGQIFIDNNTTAEIDYVGIAPDQASTKSNLFRAVEGVYNFDPMFIIMKPDTYALFQINFENFGGYQTISEQQFISFLKQPTLIVVKSRPCAFGESYTNRYTCELCEDGRSTYKARTETEKGKKCDDCLSFGVCDKENIFPAAGYVRMSDTNQTTGEPAYLFVKCFNENACLQGDINNPKVNCEEGYQGTMCSVCQDLHWRNLGNYECYPCTMPDFDRRAVYAFKVFMFYIVCYMIYQRFMSGFKLANSEILGAFKIMISYSQLLAIVSKMEASRTQIAQEATIQSFMDKLVYYTNPGEWIFDFDCLFTSAQLESGEDYDLEESIQRQKFLNRLLLTIFMPLILLVSNVVIIWLLTFCIKQCQLRKREDIRPLDCSRMFNRVFIAYCIQMFFVMPPLLHLVFASMQCFESLSMSETGKIIERMSLVPDISCDSDFYAQVYYSALIPSVVVYCILMPIFLVRQVLLKSHWIFHSGRDRKAIENEEIAMQKKIVSTKSFWGFYFSGFRIGQLLKREITNSDFPIENIGTAAAKNQRSPFKICGQSCKEKLLTFFIYPLIGNGILVRISPDHVNKSFFYWEMVIFFEKITLIALTVSFQDSIVDSQLTCAIIFIGLFYLLQVVSQPYFTERLNSLQMATYIATIGYAICRVLANAITYVNYGGQVNPKVSTNIVIPTEQYEFTRGYLNRTDTLLQNLIQVVYLVNVLLILYAVFLWLQIIYFQFLIYLVVNEERQRLFKGIQTATADQIAEKLGKTAHTVVQRHAAEQDCCAKLRWNHEKCLMCWLCNPCRKQKYPSFQDFEKGPYNEYMQFLEKLTDRSYDKWLKLQKLSQIQGDSSQLPLGPIADEQRHTEESKGDTKSVISRTSQLVSMETHSYTTQAPFKQTTTNGHNMSVDQSDIIGIGHEEVTKQDPVMQGRLKLKKKKTKKASKKQGQSRNR